jgi:F-type H+-transporting ATPase subunit gamma
MANLLALKRRIKTAQNVSKTTKAMQMISASKLKRAQEAALSARPYVTKLTEISTAISERVSEDDKNDYMKKLTDSNEKLMIVVSPDKGLCGGLNTNLTRELLNFYKENKNTTFITVGKKANGMVNIIGGNAVASFDIGTTLPSYELVYPVMNLVDDHFLNKKVSEVYILNTTFTSLFSQKPFVKRLLPAVFEATEGSTNTEAIFEPSAAQLLPGLIRNYLELSVYQAMLENYLSEQAARMLAMQNATDNAKEIIKELKLMYNKQRQEKITNEILDISGGIFANV